MSRPRATEHCAECGHFTFEFGQKACIKSGFRFVSRVEARTSPRWCPLGHVIQGRPYPTFTPGKDPRDVVDVASVLRLR